MKPVFDNATNSSVFWICAHPVHRFSVDDGRFICQSSDLLQNQ